MCYFSHLLVRLSLRSTWTGGTFVISGMSGSLRCGPGQPVRASAPVSLSQKESRLRVPNSPPPGQVDLRQISLLVRFTLTQASLRSVADRKTFVS